MASPFFSFLHFVLFFLLTISSPSSSSSPTSPPDNPQTFIVHVSKAQKPTLFSSHHDWYTSIIHSLPPSPHPTKILYTYGHAIHGFSAYLTATQAEKLLHVPGILSVVSDQIHQLDTTRTPDFLGLSDSSGVWVNGGYGDGVIIGVLDTGIWPEHRSFADSGLSPPPANWKGSCETGPDFPSSSCNNKLIGARMFFRGYEASIGVVDETRESKSPRDTNGHGTHCASTAAGSAVHNASFYHYARGEARGVALKAKIASYKICWLRDCSDADILAAMDQAIYDGVHVISLSVSRPGSPLPYYSDSIAVGAYGAAANGIVVSISAGNSGPYFNTITNLAPWMLTVGASTIDREFRADVVLGDGRTFAGVSLYADSPLGNFTFPLVYAGDYGSRHCEVGSLDPLIVRGKIVVCDRANFSGVMQGYAVQNARGIGMILANTHEFFEDVVSAEPHLLPATMVGVSAGNWIKDYISRSQFPTATIVFRGTIIGNSPPAPKVALFSSRGPNSLTPEILKPDVIAPGVNILAGWTLSNGPSGLDVDTRRVEFNIISGTSMACPHVSGIAALLRNVNPDWSPAAIKSAIMTTAYNLDNSGNPIKDLTNGAESTPFIHGAGHVDPNRALDPGLVYDIDSSDYIPFLCAIGYDSTQIAILTREPISSTVCDHKWTGPDNANYPSFSVVFRSGNDVVSYKRVVKNVGNNTDAVYEVKVNAPVDVDIKVSPSKLVFSSNITILSYEITFSTSPWTVPNSPRYGSIEWSDGVHQVRSPITVLWSLTSKESRDSI